MEIIFNQNFVQHFFFFIWRYSFLFSEVCECFSFFLFQQIVLFRMGIRNFYTAVGKFFKTSIRKNIFQKDMNIFYLSLHYSSDEYKIFFKQVLRNFFSKNINFFELEFSLFKPVYWIHENYLSLNYILTKKWKRNKDKEMLELTPQVLNFLAQM